MKSRAVVMQGIEQHTNRMMELHREVNATAKQKQKGKGKTQQRDLEGKDLTVPDVEETLDDIQYVRIVEKTEKFRLVTKDTAIRGLQAKELLAFVRKRVRPMPNAEIGKGDFDKACEVIYKMLLAYPR